MTNLSLSGFLKEVNGKMGLQPDKKEGQICYTDASKTNKGTGAGVHGYDTGQMLSFSLGK
jgi:hypothetical protein